jgi:hypothetical protein
MFRFFVYSAAWSVIVIGAMTLIAIAKEVFK